MARWHAGGGDGSMDNDPFAPLFGTGGEQRPPPARAWLIRMRRSASPAQLLGQKRFGPCTTGSKGSMCYDAA